MKMSRSVAKAVVLGDYLPRQCGIATFTRDLFTATLLDSSGPRGEVIAVTDPGQSYDYPPEVRFEIVQEDIQSYLRAADFLNLSHADVLCVQHEFGIFGGEAGAHLIALLRRARLPTVTTLHTILREPNPAQRRAFTQLIACSTKLVVMTRHGADILRSIYHVPSEKIAIIPHGIPDVPFVDPNFYKDQFGVAGRPVLLTFGLLSPGKGIEYAISALPEIIRHHPNIIYIILGATHPNLIREQGETYRLRLERLARELGVQDNVMFVNRFVSNADLNEFIGAADIYLTPYLNEAQITSGTLAYCYGAGKAVISTPYWHAAELLADGSGVLVPFRDSAAIAHAVIRLLNEDAARHAMRKAAYLAGRDMVWAQVGHAYRTVFEEAVHLYVPAPTRTAPTLDSARADLPALRLDHLAGLTDSTGTFQHACYSLPWFEHGYCTDDNARTLVLAALLEDINEPFPELDRIRRAAAAFLQHAFRPDTERFRNFLSFDRRWLEDTGSEDSHARALWGLGALVGRTEIPSLRAWSAAAFERALPAVEHFRSPRAFAFALLGIHDYMRVFHGDLLVERLRLELATRLANQFAANASSDWPWLEDIVAYDNARIPQALILTGRWTQNTTLLDLGLRTLRWLMDQQTAPAGHFRPIGSNGFWKRGHPPATYDQQPIEAAAAVSACIEACHATSNRIWEKDARRAFEWFLGANDLGLSLYDPRTGGCCDGLHESRVNQNQGAESTLSFLIALAEMRLFQNATASFGPDLPSL